MPKRSENAKAVARKVIEKVQKGEKVDLGDIIASQGYGPGTARHPGKVTNTASYKEETQSFVQLLIHKRQQAIDAITQDKVDSAGYSNLVAAIDTFTKNIQLLSGQETERQGITVNIVSYKDADNKI